MTPSSADNHRQVAKAREVIANAGRALRQKDDVPNAAAVSGGGQDAGEKFKQYQKLLKKALKENPLAPYGMRFVKARLALILLFADRQITTVPCGSFLAFP